jgi:hypothetical protein
MDREGKLLWLIGELFCLCLNISLKCIPTTPSAPTCIISSHWALSNSCSMYIVAEEPSAPSCLVPSAPSWAYRGINAVQEEASVCCVQTVLHVNSCRQLQFILAPLLRPVVKLIDDRVYTARSLRTYRLFLTNPIPHPYAHFHYCYINMSLAGLRGVVACSFCWLESEDKMAS